MNLTSALSRLEKRLQKLVEDRLDGIFTTTDLQKILSHELLLALQREARPTSDGRMLAPDTFTIYLPSDTAQRLAAYHNRLDELGSVLTETIEDFSRQGGYSFASKLSIHFLTDPVTASPQSPKATILATFALHESTQTATLGIAANLLGNTGSEPPEQQTSRAFLIVNGVEIFPLPGRQSSGVINIGRLSGNQLVLEDGRVSRTHAQLRIMQGRYMLFDLASTHGTFVNGLRVNQHELKAGDVISFGGFPVVFGVEELPSNPSISFPPSQPVD